MTLARVFLRVIMLGILVVSILSERPKGCNITRILEHYRAITYKTIQDLKNLSAAVTISGQSRGKPGPPCWNQTELRILRSLYSLSLSLTCEVIGRDPGRLERAVRIVATNIEEPLSYNCPKMKLKHREKKTLGCKTPEAEPEGSTKAPASRRRSRNRQWRRILDIVDNITDCWQRLYSFTSHKLAGFT